MKRTLVCLALVAVLALAGCATSANATVGKSDAGSAVELAVGKTLTVELEGNPTTGYNWAAAKVPACLKQVGEAEFAPSSDAIGAGGTITLTFEAVEAGEGTLELWYARAWESVQPLETYTVDVTVK